MIDINKQRAIGIKQSNQTIANIQKRMKAGKQKPNDRFLLQETQDTLARWERMTPRGVKL